VTLSEEALEFGRPIVKIDGHDDPLALAAEIFDLLMDDVDATGIIGDMRQDIADVEHSLNTPELWHYSSEIDEMMELLESADEALSSLSLTPQPRHSAPTAPKTNNYTASLATHLCTPR